MFSLLYGLTLTSVHDYWKKHSFDHKEFVGKVMSLLFNAPSRFVIAFLPRSNCLLISWLQSPPAVILELKKRKSVPASTFSPFICQEVMGPDGMISGFLMLSMATGWQIQGTRGCQFELCINYPSYLAHLYLTLALILPYCSNCSTLM